ncbi:MAG: tyrosine-type recombinase/integrase [Thermoguttaceae bacterium]
MPKLTRPPKLSHFKPRNLAYVTWKGKRHYLGKYGSAEAAAAYARFIANLAEAAAGEEAASEPPRVGWITITELCAAYWQFAERYYQRHGRPTEQACKVKRRIRILVDHYGTLPVNEFSAKRLKVIQAALVAEGYSRVGVNERVNGIRRIFKWGTSEDLVSPAVHQALVCVPGLRKGRTEARELPPVLPVDDATVEATLPFLSTVVADMIRFQRLTGCRPGEVCGIRPMDVDRSGEVWVYRPASHKTEHHGKERFIFIGPKAQSVLMPYLLRPADAYCFSPADSEKQRLAELHAARVTPMSCGNKPGSNRVRRAKKRPGDRYTKDSYNRAITRAITAANAARKKAAAEIGVQPVLLASWSPNRLRHAAATEVRRQFGLEAAQVTLGHSKANTTEIYAERDHDLARTVALRIG